MDKIKFFLDDNDIIIDFNLLEMRKQELRWQNRRGLYDLIFDEKIESKTAKHFYIFSRAFDDFIEYFLSSAYYKSTIEKLKKGEIEKVIFFFNKFFIFS